MKEYWTDEETGITHKILFDGKYYMVIDGDTGIYLDDEDVFDENELEEMKGERPLTEYELWEIEGDKRDHELRDIWWLEQRYS